MKRLILLILLLPVFVFVFVEAAEPPDLMNFQGVLRDNADQPLNGSYDIIFAFFDADSAGNEILFDTHAGPDSVLVSGGLFNVPLGSGSVADGSGPGAYTSLADIFRDHNAVWLEIRVGAETLSPRIRIASAAYALNSTHLGGRVHSDYLDTSDSIQGKSGPLVVDSRLASANPAITAIGLGTGATVSGGAYGLSAIGGIRGGRFFVVGDSGQADVASGGTGIEAFGNDRGGYFEDLDGSGFAEVAVGEIGIEASGNGMGGYFTDRDGSGVAQLGTGDTGIVGSGDIQGVVGYGNSMGGYFYDSDDSGLGRLGWSDTGVDGRGAYQAFRNGGGGRFEDTLYTGKSYVAHGNEGIYAEGSFAGGEFRDTSPANAARVLAAWSSIGIAAYGLDAGGFFQDDTSGTWAYIANDAQSTAGTGAKNFVQNHPYDDAKVVVYTSLEGDHAATFTRGSARTRNGSARVALGATFRLVTNPDIGLSAHVTPRGAWSELYVESVSTEEIVVASRDGSDAAFDYVVYGLRIGFEEFPALQPKPREARLPAMIGIERMFENEPALRSTTALARFEEMRVAQGLPGRADLSGGDALKTAIGVFDPNIDGEKFPVNRGIESQSGVKSVAVSRAAIAAEYEPDPFERAPEVRPAPVAGPPKAVTAGIDRPGRAVLPVVETPMPGDVMGIDPDYPGMLKKTSSIADPAVFGVVVELLDEPQRSSRRVSVATAELINVRVDASFGEIRAGDLLVSSPTPGHAMRAMELRPGTILGKALDGLESGTGTIRVLLTLR